MSSRRVVFSILILLALRAIGSDIYAQSVCGDVFSSAPLEANGIRTSVFNDGSLFWRLRSNGGGYFLKDHEDINLIFRAGIWLGGKVNGEIRTAVSETQNSDFSPGPIDSIRTETDCAPFNRTYRIATRDFRALENGIEPGDDVVEWPWREGAPVIDGDGNPDNYNLEGGDRPELLGDETIFWIMNDVDSDHPASHSQALGVEVHGTAFSAVSTDVAINTSTFYRFRVINKSDATIDSTFFAANVDVDLGAPFDDYMGSDSLLSLGFVYNADNDDNPDRGGFGSAPPAVGIQIIDGPTAHTDGLDNDYDGSIDESDETLGMTSFFMPQFSCGIAGCEFNPRNFYLNMQARWLDGRAMTSGGFGRSREGRKTTFLFSGEPPAFWSELNVDGKGQQSGAGDRRMVVNVGPFTLTPGQEETIFFGIYTAFGADNLDSITELKKVATRFRDIRPADIGPDQNPQAVQLETPFALSPGDNAIGQPVDIEFRWLTGEPSDRFQLQLAEGDDVTRGVIYWDTSVFDLKKDAIYSWRVREYSTASYGPWSKTNMFSTGVTTATPDGTVIKEFVVTANAAGKLDPPIAASADWMGFPGGRPTIGQQSTNDGQWLINAWESGACINACGNYDTFVNRAIVQRDGWESVLPYDWEIRFETEGNHFGWEVFSSGDLIDVPFSLWRTGINTPDDPTDDVRYIPGIYDADGNGAFGMIPEDHSVSGGNDDPTTDWIYYFKPVDDSPGSAGYDTWLSTKLAGGSVNSLYDGQSIGRLVFVGLNHGDVSDGTLDAVPDSLRLPEPGTVFRIALNPLEPPVLNSPGWGERVPVGDVYLYWSSLLTKGFTIEIAPFISFTSLFKSIEIDGRQTTVDLAPGTYYWRVRDPIGGVSKINQLVVDRAVGVAVDNFDEPDEPFEFFIAPNPVQSAFDLILSGSTREIEDIGIYDVLGRRLLNVKTANETLSRGQRLSLDATHMAAGVYFVRIRMRSGNVLSKSVVKL